MWSPDGRSVLFVGAADTIFKAPVTLGAAPVIGRPEQVARVKMGYDGSRLYTVARDGRILAIEDISPESPTIVIVQNWTSELQRLVPTR
jgi:hypothetical protein